MANPVRELRVRVVVLTLQVSCDACGAVDWLDPRECDAIARFAAVHVMPSIDQAELLVNDVHRIVPAVLTR